MALRALSPLLAAPAQAQSTDATLSALSVNGTSVAGFAQDVTTYRFGVAASVARATVLGVAADTGATVAYSGVDADGDTGGHQVDLVEGSNVVTVTAEDAVTMRDYTVSINRGTDAPTGWKAATDLDTLAAGGNNNAQGIWSDDTTMWVADRRFRDNS